MGVQVIRGRVRRRRNGPTEAKRDSLNKLGLIYEGARMKPPSQIYERGGR